MSPATPDLEALRSAVEALYSTFARYPLRPRVEGCPHCVSAEDNALLHSRPLRQLTAKDLAHYSFKALTTWGDVNDFKHFLPRLLELLAFDEVACNPEILTEKLGYASLSQWPKSEQNTVETYLMALWRAVLDSFPSALPSHWNADTCLCCIGRAVDNLEPYLAYWQRNRSAPAARHLVEFINENVERLLRRGRLSNPFWDERQAQMRQVIAWLADPRTAEALEQAFFDHSSAPFADEISYAVDQLTWIRTTLQK